MTYLELQARARRNTRPLVLLLAGAVVAIVLEIFLVLRSGDPAVPRTLADDLSMLAGIAFVLGVIIKIFMDPGNLPAWLSPQTLWKGAIGGVGFSLVFLLMEVRDILLHKK